MLPFFVSPGTIAKLATAKGKPVVARKSFGQRDSVGHVQTFVDPRHRPKGTDRGPRRSRLLKSVLTATYQVEAAEDCH